MNNLLNTITLREKVGQLFFPAAFVNDTEANYIEIENLIKNCGVGGLTFFHSRLSAATNYEGKNNSVANDNSAALLKALIVRYQRVSKIPLLISIDAEWGLAMRIEKTPQYPYAITLGALPDNENKLLFEVGKHIGFDLKQLGIHYNLAPVADVNDNPKNPVIGYRSFGDDKYNVTQKTLSFSAGLRNAGILSCLKHFPGHGNTEVDSHLGLPVIKKTISELQEQELFPFKEAIRNNEVDSIMIGHLAVPALTDGKILSATLSSQIIQNLLRLELGYQGLIISDALNMHSVSKLYPEKGLLEWKAFEAGNDALCFSENVAEGIEKIMALATTYRIDESWNRILNLKTNCKLFDAIDLVHPDEKIVFDFKAVARLNFEIATKVITITKNELQLLPIDKTTKNAVLSIYNSKDAVFCSKLKASINADFIEILNDDTVDHAKIMNHIDSFDKVIIALFVPSVKPINNFEIDFAILNLLEELFKNSKVILCLFGNPIALSVLPGHKKIKTIVHCYQQFDTFQEVAANVLQQLDGTNRAT